MNVDPDPPRYFKYSSHSKWIIRRVALCCSITNVLGRGPQCHQWAARQTTLVVSHHPQKNHKVIESGFSDFDVTVSSNSVLTVDF
jgi:hypothetical protein